MTYLDYLRRKRDILQMKCEWLHVREGLDRGDLLRYPREVRLRRLTIGACDGDRRDDDRMRTTKIAELVQVEPW